MTPTDRRHDPKFATTLAHGIALLESFDIGHAALTNKQLAERTGLSKATVSRLTSTLQERGLILFDAQARRYRLASTALTIGYPLLASLEIRREARLGMKRLADELGGSVSLGMRDRTRMIYVETSRGNDPIAFRPDVGAALPMLQTAMGRAWLAAVSADLRSEVLATLRTQTPELHAKWAGSIERALDDLQRRGFCVSRGDWQSDVHAIAVPLELLIDTERLVINCGVPQRRLLEGELEAKIGPRVIELARHIESHWRAGTPAP
ncbi:MAG: IclR family transcriptional regulator [Cupriavidus necator]